MNYVLKKGGNVTYYPNYLSEDFTRQLWNEIYPSHTYKKNIDFKTKSDEIISVETNFGMSTSGVEWKQLISDNYNKIFAYPRLTTSMFDPDANIKSYSNSDSSDISNTNWTPCMKYLKDYIEKNFNEKITYAIFQQYRSTADYLGYHSDREMNSKDKVFSVSLGIRRRFGFRQKYNDKGEIVTSGPPEFELWLENGSLLVFNYEAGCKNYKHQLFKGLKSEGHSCPNSKCSAGQEWCGCTRINITFRTFY